MKVANSDNKFELLSNLNEILKFRVFFPQMNSFAEEFIIGPWGSDVFIGDVFQDSFLIIW